jgi:hypothetical protein
MRCEVKKSNAQNCAKPQAAAYDHHGGMLPKCEDTSSSACLKERLFLINYDNSDELCDANGANCASLPLECNSASLCKGVSFNTTSTYLYKYDATDASGNHAEQIVFGLIIDDVTPPSLQFESDDRAADTTLFVCHTQGGGCSPSTCHAETGSTKPEACTDNVDDQDQCDYFNRYRPDFRCKWKQAAAGPECFDDYFSQGYVEAATSWGPCAVRAYDDNDLYTTVKYSIYHQEANKWLIPQSQPVVYASALAVWSSEARYTPGTYTIHISSEDSAGGYGKDGTNNKVADWREVEVKDTRDPWIVIGGEGMNHTRTEYDTVHYPCNNETHKWGCKRVGYPLECGVVYKNDCTADEIANQAGMNIACDAGAQMFDDLDCQTKTCPLAVTSSMAATGNKTVDEYKTTDQIITYTGKDAHNNWAEPQYRVVSVEDTTPPVLRVMACTNSDGVEVNCVHQAGSSAAWVDPGVECVDTCDPSPRVVSYTWDRAFDGTTLGTYVRTYTCLDAHNHSVTATRTLEVVDTMSPVVNALPCPQAPASEGAPHCQVEASKDTVFTDPGATCDDQRDGNLNDNIVLQGMVNMSVPGDYTIKYLCNDTQGQTGSFERKVFVRDNIKPDIILRGKSVEYVEAGFPWVDPMTPCVLKGCAVDNIDGDISHKITSTGNTVNTFIAFATYRTCKEIFDADNTALSGEYMLTLPGPAGGVPKAEKVYCDMTHKQTYVPLTGAAEITPYYRSNGTFVADAGDCADFGLATATFADTRAGRDACAAMVAHFGSNFFATASMALKAIPNTVGGYSADETSMPQICLPITEDGQGNPEEASNYICSTADETYSHTAVSHSDTKHAVPGTYVINYSVKDNSDNENTTQRTVIVKDTLAPVIVMQIADKTHVSDYSAKGLGGVANPAGTASSNPFISMMAEDTQSSVNGWFVAAAASAVTGIALLAMRKDAAVATSVPV